jgi:hypothetical protein
MHLPRTVQHILVSKVKKNMFLESDRRTRYTQVHASTYWYILSHTHATTFHINRVLSALRRVCAAGAFPTTLDLFFAHSFLPLRSILQRQTTQAGLAAPKLPQPGVNLIDIAAPPCICCRCVSAPEREALRLLNLSVTCEGSSELSYQANNTSQKQGNKGDPAHKVLGGSHVETRCWGGRSVW